MLTTNEIKMILPQKGQMVMVDTLKFHDGIDTITELEVRSTNIFCSNSILFPSGIIENMAQTFLITKYLEQKIHSSSYYVLASVNQLKVIRHPRSGEMIATRTKLIKSSLGISRISGESFIKDELVAESIFTIKEINNVGFNR